MGYATHGSEILVRMLFYGPELPDDARWRRRLERAVQLRRDLLRLDDVTDAYRLVHAEADRLSGLVVDRLGDTLSAEAYSLGMYQRAPAILALLAEMCGTRHTLIRPSPQFLSQEGMEPPRNLFAGTARTGDGERIRDPLPRAFRQWAQDGLLLRPARRSPRRLAEFCGGRSVLDLCCYTGGFAVQAKRWAMRPK